MPECECDTLLNSIALLIETPGDRVSERIEASSGTGTTSVAPLAAGDNRITAIGAPTKVRFVSDRSRTIWLRLR
jgi:hypothetical protein